MGVCGSSAAGPSRIAPDGADHSDPPPKQLTTSPQNSKTLTITSQSLDDLLRTLPSEAEALDASPGDPKSGSSPGIASGATDGGAVRKRSQNSMKRAPPQWMAEVYTPARKTIKEGISELEELSTDKVVISRQGLLRLLSWTETLMEQPGVRRAATRQSVATGLVSEMRRMGTSANLASEMEQYILGTFSTSEDRRVARRELTGKIVEEDEEEDEEHMSLVHEDATGADSSSEESELVYAVEGLSQMERGVSELEGGDVHEVEEEDEEGVLGRGGGGGGKNEERAPSPTSSASPIPKSSALPIAQRTPTGTSGRLRGTLSSGSVKSGAGARAAIRVARLHGRAAALLAGGGARTIQRRFGRALHKRIEQLPSAVDGETRAAVARILMDFGQWGMDVIDVQELLYPHAKVLPLVTSLALQRNGFLARVGGQGSERKLLPSTASVRIAATSSTTNTPPIARAHSASTTTSTSSSKKAPLLRDMSLRMRSLVPWRLDEAKVEAFLQRIAADYKPENPYHTEIHAADVTYTTYCLLLSPSLSGALAPAQRLALLLGAAVHDVAHPGTTTAFEAETRSKLATRYNDKAVLENMHAAHAFTLLRSPGGELDALSTLTKKQRTSVREAMVEAILHTDMARHFALIDRVDENLVPLAEEIHSDTPSGDPVQDSSPSPSPSPALSSQGEDQKQGKAVALRPHSILLSCLLLHAADVSNPVKPLRTYRRWAERVQEEFWRLGDKQRDLRLTISPNCDRNSPAVATCQLGFIQFIVRPLYERIWTVLPERKEELESTLDANTACYKELQAEEDRQEQRKEKDKLAIPEEDEEDEEHKS